MVDKLLVEENLRKVLDPELGVNIVDLGLIYDVTVKAGDVFILMTLTFPGCPLGAIISKEVNNKIGTLDGVGKVHLEITFNPPWDVSKIKEEARLELGI